MQTAWYLAFLLQLLFYDVKTTHVTGVLKSGEKFKFLQKFAIINAKDHQIHLYGNFNGSLNATLIFVPSEVWKHLEDKITDNDKKCSDLATLCDASYIRRFPCVDGECQNTSLVPHSQITYSINSSSTQFYYAVLLSCIYDDDSCSWENSNSEGYINYDVWLVSGDPFTTKHDSFTYQFSYHQHGILIVLVIIITLYGILLPFHLVGYTCVCGRCQMPKFVRIFTVALFLEFSGLTFIVIHFSLFADDGKGIPALYDIGFFFEILADCVLLLIVLLVAKGYRVTISVIRQKKVLFVVWLVYFSTVITFTLWTLVSTSKSV